MKSIYSKEQDKFMLDQETKGFPKRVIAIQMSEKFNLKITEEAVKKRLARIRPAKKQYLQGIRTVYREKADILREKSRLRKWDVPGIKLDYIAIKYGIECKPSMYL